MRKIGSIVFDTAQGLGVLAKSFFDNGIISKVLVYPHSTRQAQGYFPGSRPYSLENEDWLLEDIDTLLFFETPFNWKIIPKAREKGIKVVLMPMYECTRYPFPYEPDLIICPSLLDLEYYKDKNAVFMPVPVAVKHKKRSRARIFVHNAGNGGIGGRNGTRELIEAMEYVKSPIKLIIRAQEKMPEVKDPRITVEGHVSYDKLFSEGDVFIFPEKFNGLSLPLQEAYASGMLVMAGDRFPINTWLPKEPLIPVERYTKERIAVTFDCAHYNPMDIAKTIDSWYNQDISNYSELGRLWGIENSWGKLKAKYLELL